MERRGFGSTAIGTVGFAIAGGLLTAFFTLAAMSPNCEGSLPGIVFLGGLVGTAVVVGLWVVVGRQRALAIALQALIALVVFYMVWALPVTFVAAGCGE